MSNDQGVTRSESPLSRAVVRSMQDKFARASGIVKRPTYMQPHAELCFVCDAAAYDISVMRHAHKIRKSPPSLHFAEITEINVNGCRLDNGTRCQLSPYPHFHVWAVVAKVWWHWLSERHKPRPVHKPSCGRRSAITPKHLKVPAYVRARIVERLALAKLVDRNIGAELTYRGPLHMLRLALSGQPKLLGGVVEEVCENA